MSNPNSTVAQESSQLAPLLRCTICTQTFRRAEHLKRHMSTRVDANNKLYTCSFCGSRYKRRDTLRRHWKTCTPRLASGDQLPQRAPSGKRKKACDNCATSKRACDEGTPCSQCLMRESECTYRRITVDESPNHTHSHTEDINNEERSEINQTETDLTASTLTVTKPETSQHLLRTDSATYFTSSTKHRFKYLAHFTQATGLHDAYNYQRSCWSDVSSAGMLDDPSLLFESMHENSFQPNPWGYFLDEIEAGFDIYGQLHRSHSPDSPTSVKASEIWDMFRPIGNGSARLIEMNTVIEFFSPDNLTRYLDLFWDRCYPHFPIIHRPTFDLMTCPTILLLNMVLIGSLTSPYARDREEARQFLDVAEDLLFSQPIFSDNNAGQTNEKGSSEHRRIYLLQAAYFMCIMQKWEGDRLAKLRIQRSRFTAFVAAARASGLSKVKQKPLIIDSNFGEQDWKEYIRREEMIRIFTYVFLLDSAFVIFHSSVPRMVLQEMTVQLACPEELFRASSAADFALASGSYPQITEPIPLLADCIRQLCSDDPSDIVISQLKSTSVLNLFIIATGKHL
ncbi:putative transcription factor with C2H2 and Zn(2)-Cys(6) DNA binding domain [Xylogone sp. PMI_703]|nr:putative transcription factor with C2H2 and Zn(2)-Cys(6) DNA binding domain [Xylogone sp. PMI_703]